MADETFILIPGRTARQGTSLNEGKGKADYRDETATLFLNAEDMKRLGLAIGDRAVVASEFGSIVLTCKAGAKDEIPPGLAFMPYGPPVCELIGGETHGTGMPDSKAIDVAIRRAS